MLFDTNVWGSYTTEAVDILRWKQTKIRGGSGILFDFLVTHT